jgi:uncharacterized protein YndB with AHSA1/START domain
MRVQGNVVRHAPSIQLPTSNWYHTGVYREVTPPEKLIFTWTSANTLGQETLVTVVLRALNDDRTELRLTQALLPTDAATQQHRRGWTQILDHLMTYLRAR